MKLTVVVEADDLAEALEDEVVIEVLTAARAAVEASRAAGRRIELGPYWCRRCRKYVSSAICSRCECETDIT